MSEEMKQATDKLRDLIRHLPTEDEQRRIEQAWKDMAKTSAQKRAMLDRQSKTRR